MEVYGVINGIDHLWTKMLILRMGEPDLKLSR